MRRMVRRTLERAALLVLPVAARITRPLTIGVRAMVFDSEGRVCLVRHSYVQGLHFPGGAVEPGETLAQALTRELDEEAGLAPVGRPELFGIYFNEVMGRRDHVAVYVVRAFTKTGRRPSPLEIVEHGFHAQDALPDDVTGPTRRRLQEFLEKRDADQLW